MSGMMALDTDARILIVDDEPLARQHLRVLLVSGEPHSGERTWRNILKSDPSVDLVHFTILRPPEKQDGTPIRELSLIAFPTRELFQPVVDRLHRLHHVELRQDLRQLFEPVLTQLCHRARDYRSSATAETRTDGASHSAGRWWFRERNATWARQSRSRASSTASMQRAWRASARAR